MAQTSLRAYQDKLDSLLLEDKRDAVIAHARHIIQSAPLNLRAWSQFAAALQADGRGDDAAAVWRRVLGARPLDFKTHWQLAQVYQATGQGERAILHAERAYDLRPKDAEAGALLRRLYAEVRGQDARPELSPGGLAQECIRDSQLEKALDILGEALSADGTRLDLRLLRTRALWLEGQRMAAAETADEILRQLPYAIAANRIMAELWLDEQRPSDARPYLERIESLDPYLAHQLAGSALPADDLITLDELAEADETAAGETPLELPDLVDDALVDAIFKPRPPVQNANTSQVASPAFIAPQVDSSESEADADLGGLDEDLERALQQLDEDAEPSNAWLMEALGAAEPAAESDPFDADAPADWLDADATADDTESAGAPWLSAAMREMQDDAEDDLDLFADDEQLQALLRQTDTEPINLADIDAWLDEDEPDDAALADAPDSELLDATPGDWRDDALDELSPLSEAEQSRRRMSLIDSWQSELDADDDDPYVDWLSEEDAAEMDDELRAADTADLPPVADAAEDAARAWGLNDASQLADFVEQEAQSGDAAAPPGFLNAALPGLDREGDADAENPQEFARPIGRLANDFAWVSDIVDEETGGMPAIHLDESPAEIPFFRFENPPVWLANMAPPLSRDDIMPMAAAVAPALVNDLDALDLDDLTFDDYFNIDTPTDRMDAISLDEGVDNIDFAEMGWDDYFELESPTEKTIAINLADDAPADFRALDVDEADFGFDTPTEKMPAISLNEEISSQAFDDIGPDAASADQQSEAGKSTR